MNQNALSAEDVRRVAALAHLALPDEQVERLRTELGAVLHHVEALGGLDLEGVEPMASPLDQTNRTAPDEPATPLTNEQLREIAPETDGPYIKVPKVLGDSGGSA